ncbi:TetR/AcrR family transcriptional regulator [Aliamphritea hakodatensis]|uniref:TetR/AcrR family transcriptional regulator n=1 Tax=Aliamphritea hakodatensis TaxID=2895352 RepID=UPI0022FD7BCF|nr:TetR/AcrR family transcriptional regulator [Aliamphritea hakodatensis]
MGRPSKKAERTEEIFQAFQRCVIRFGLEGSTLERIAEEAGLQRSLVRHYVGNRSELVEQLAERTIEQSNQQWTALEAHLPATDISQPLLSMLFDYENSNDISLLFQALLFSAAQDASLKQKLRDWTEHNVAAISQLLRRDYPDADAGTLKSVAFGLLSLYFNLDSLSPLGLMADYRLPARQAAEQLLSALKTA